MLCVYNIQIQNALNEIVANFTNEINCRNFHVFYNRNDHPKRTTLQKYYDVKIICQLCNIYNLETRRIPIYSTTK